MGNQIILLEYLTLIVIICAKYVDMYLYNNNSTVYNHFYNYINFMQLKFQLTEIPIDVTEYNICYHHQF